MSSATAAEAVPISAGRTGFRPAFLLELPANRRETIKSTLREPLAWGDPAINALVRQNNRLRRSVEELSILHDVAKEIADGSSPDHTLEMLARRARDVTDAEHGAICLGDPSTDSGEGWGCLPETPDPQWARLQEAVANWVRTHKEPLVTSQSQELGLGEALTDAGVKTLLSVPLLIDDSFLGMLTVWNKEGGRSFTHDDKRLLVLLASEAVQIVERMRLYKTEREWLTLTREVELARQIQSRLVPTEPPHVPGYDMAGVTRSARTVGGDFFSFLPRQDGSLAIWLGDVVGKGLPAAMLMANLQATIRDQTLTGAPEHVYLARANRALCQSTAAESFATLFYGVLDLKRHALRYVNAGHNAPFLLRADGGCQRLHSGVTVLGLFEDWSAKTDEVAFEPGDLLVVFSDGISEATNTQDQQLGERRLGTICDGMNGRAASEALGTILDSVAEHTGNAPQTDDMTLVAVRRNPKG